MDGQREKEGGVGERDSKGGGERGKGRGERREILSDFSFLNILQHTLHRHMTVVVRRSSFTTVRRSPCNSPKYKPCSTANAAGVTPQSEWETGAGWMLSYTPPPPPPPLSRRPNTSSLKLPLQTAFDPDAHSSGLWPNKESHRNNPRLQCCHTGARAGPS